MKQRVLCMALRGFIGSEQSVISDAINTWRRRLHACIRVKGRHLSI